MATGYDALANALGLKRESVLNPQSFDQYIAPRIENFSSINPSIANAFSSLLQNRNDTISDTQRNILGLYDAYQNVTNPTFQNYIANTVRGGQGLLQDIDRQRAQLEGLYGPQGSQYRLLDDYYTRMANIIENRARGNQAAIDAAARASGASRGGVAAARARQGATDLESLLKFQEGRTGALMNTYNLFSNLLGNLQNRADQIRSNYIIAPYFELSKRQDALAQAALQNQAALEQYRMQQAVASRSKNPFAWLEALNPAVYQNVVNALNRISATPAQTGTGAVTWTAPQ